MDYEDFLYSARYAIFGMADSRKDAERLITGLGKPLLKHLMVILIYADELNRTKHIDDINNWLREAQDFTLKGSKRLKPSDYYKWLYTDRGAEDLSSLSKKIKILDASYGNLNKNSNFSLETLNRELQLIYKRISLDLSTEDFLDIRNYL